MGVGNKVGWGGGREVVVGLRVGVGVGDLIPAERLGGGQFLASCEHRSTPQPSYQ